jgi:hypothetical protein
VRQGEPTKERWSPKSKKKRGGLGPRVVCDDARHYSQEFRAWSGVWSGGDTTVANALAHYRRSKVSHWPCCLRGVLETDPSSDQNSPIAAPACVPRAAGALTGACRGGIGKPLLLSLLLLVLATSSSLASAHKGKASERWCPAMDRGIGIGAAGDGDGDGGERCSCARTWTGERKLKASPAGGTHACMHAPRHRSRRCRVGQVSPAS